MERSRGALEFVGLLILSGSLIFVALQMQQDRKIALASLSSERIDTFQSRFVAGIESDEYLEMYFNLYRTDAWDTGDLSSRQVAVAELDALIWWGYAHLSYRHYQEGFVSEEYWLDFRTELISFSKLPAFKAVYETWWKRESSSFTRFADKLIAGDA